MLDLPAQQRSDLEEELVIDTFVDGLRSTALPSHFVRALDDLDVYRLADVLLIAARVERTDE